MILGFWCKSLSGGIKCLLIDRRGSTSTAVAALISIAVIVVLMSAVSSPKGAEEVFWVEFGIAKWLAGLVGVDEHLKDFEEMLKYLQGTELWPIEVSILSMVCMIFSLLVAFVGTRAIVGTTTRVLAWRRGRREERRKIRERNEREYRFWKERQGIIDYPEQPDFESISTGYYAGQQTLGTSVGKGIGLYGKDMAEELLEQARLVRDRIIQTGGPRHEKAEEQARKWFKQHGEPIEKANRAEHDPETGESLLRYGRPDYSNKGYIIECKRGDDDEVDAYTRYRARALVQLAERVKKRLAYWFLQRPEYGSSWWPLIHMLEESDAIVIYGDE